MGLQPSSSKTELLLACQRPFAEDVAVEREEATEPMRYGSAFHEVIARLLSGDVAKPSGPRYERAIARAAARYSVKGASHELAGHVKSSFGYLTGWLTKHGWRTRGIVEKSFAIDPNPLAKSRARSIALPSVEGHHYAELRAGEIAGTVDLVVESVDAARLLILDHKSGSYGVGFEEPTRVPQMRTLGLIADPKRRQKIELAVHHADRQGLPIIYSDEYTGAEQVRHRQSLFLALSRVGDGSLRPGLQCNSCPAAATCPAGRSNIMEGAGLALVAAGVEKLQVANSVDKLSVGARAGRLYALLKAFRKLDEAGREEIRRLVASGEIVELPTGETLELVPEEYETLSKSSIVRQLGNVAGERLITKLRKQGVVEKATREKLLPRGPR